MYVNISEYVFMLINAPLSATLAQLKASVQVLAINDATAAVLCIYIFMYIYM